MTNPSSLHELTAAVVHARKTGPAGAREAEVELLRELGALMSHEGSSFDPVHDSARIVGASESVAEVRLTTAGAWKIGSGPEEDLLETWGAPSRPSLEDVLEGVQEHFSSAKIGNLVGEVRASLSGA